MSRTGRRQLWMGAVCAGVLCLVGARHAWAQSTPAVSDSAAMEIVNRASISITDVRLASRVMNTWGNNLLAAQVGPGQQRKVVPERQEGCLYSIHVVYGDKRFERFDFLDLCLNHEYVVGAKVAQPLPAQGGFNTPPQPKVNFVNRASKTISVIRLSPVDSPLWGPDRIPDQTLAATKSVDVLLGPNQGCLYRIRASYVDYLTEIIASANVCENSTITLGQARALKSDEIPSNMRLKGTAAILVSNQSGLRIDRIFVYPADDERNQGRDRLGRDNLLNNQRMRIDVSDVPPCSAKVRAVYDNGRDQETPLDLCAENEPAVAMRGPTGSSASQGMPSRP